MLSDLKPSSCWEQAFVAAVDNLVPFYKKNGDRAEASFKNGARHLNRS
jgi:hypothetical protein